MLKNWGELVARNLEKIETAWDIAIVGNIADVQVSIVIKKGFTVCAPHMSYENFLEIVKQATGKTFQIALGGAGDPNKHPRFEDILKCCRAYRIVPNMTTSGFQMTDTEVEVIKKYCGAVAVSWYSRLVDGKESNKETIDAVERFVSPRYQCSSIYFV